MLINSSESFFCNAHIAVDGRFNLVQRHRTEIRATRVAEEQKVHVFEALRKLLALAGVRGEFGNLPLGPAAFPERAVYPNIPG